MPFAASASLTGAGTAACVFNSHPEGAAMFDAVFIVLLPFLAYSLYEDWKDSVENRYKPAKKN